MDHAAEIAIVGAGYVGLTTAVTMAYLGHRVTCVDVNEDRIDCLRNGRVPFHEPHAESLLALTADQLRFTTCYAEAIPQAQVVFLAVGTPPTLAGAPDLSSVQRAAQQVGQHLGEGFTVVVNKSTVPIGSGNWVERIVTDAYRERNGSRPKGGFAVASNPEFLREGSALYDALYPDRIVVGSESAEVVEVLYSLYRPLIEQSFVSPTYLPRPEGLGAVPFVTTSSASAELIKYAANAFLALKISFINEIGDLAERSGASITQVAKGIGLDGRIGTRFMQAGVGWGGSCFGKDTAALVDVARDYGLSMPIVEATRTVNYRQRSRVLKRLLQELKILRGRTIGLLGLAFKPGTDDLRDAPALDIARQLIDRGAKVVAHDPVALPRARSEYGELGIWYFDDPRDMAAEADALVLVTDWPQYQALPWEELAAAMHAPLLLDGRNFLDGERLTKAGFTYLGWGGGA